MSKFDGLLSVKSGAAKQEPEKELKTPQKPLSAPKKGKSRPAGKRSDPDYTQITAYIRKNTHENVMRKIYKRQELSELIEELLDQWMKKSK